MTFLQTTTMVLISILLTLMTAVPLHAAATRSTEKTEIFHHLEDLRLGNWEKVCNWFCGDGKDFDYDYLDWFRGLEEENVQPRIFCDLCTKKINGTTTTTAKSTTSGTKTSTMATTTTTSHTTSANITTTSKPTTS